MKNNKLDKDQLIALLQENLETPFARECLAIVKSGSVQGFSTGLGNRASILRTYRIRSTNKEEGGRTTYGYDLLLRNLGETQYNDVKCNVVRTGDRHLIVFTDGGFHELLGILSAPVDPNYNHTYADE